MTRDSRPATKDWTALMLAARGGHLDIVHLLLTAGAEPNATDDPSNEHRATVRFMYQHEDVERVDMDGLRLGRTACHFAAAHGHTEVVRALLEAGSHVNTGDHAGKTPLMVACQWGFLALARLMIFSGAAVDGTDIRGCNALSRAAAAGHAEVVQLLLEAGAMVDALDGEQRTPLMWAAGGAHAETVRVLLHAGADVGVQAVGGFGVLCAAIYAAEHFEDTDGSATIRTIPEERILPVVELLLESGADDAPDGTGANPSHRAEEQGHVAVARLLRERGDKGSYRRTG